MLLIFFRDTISPVRPHHGTNYMRSDVSKRRKCPVETKFRFTKTALAAALSEVKGLGFKQVECCDTECRGLHAIIYASGQIVFHSRYVYRKRPSHKKIGEYGVFSIEAARAQHNATRLLIAQGGNPRAENIQCLTLDDFFEHYFLPHCQGRKKSLHTDLSRYNARIKPELGGLLLSDITPTLINRLMLRLLNEIALAPATVNRHLELLRTCFTLAVELGFLAKSPAACLKLLPENNQRTDFPTVSELSAFMRAAEQEPSLPASRALMLLVLTGARLGEALKAEWKHIDLTTGIWRLPIQKSGKPGVIHLSDAAKSVIEDMQEVRCNQYLFPGLGGIGHLARPIRAFARICERAGLLTEQSRLRFRIHDLRHGWCSAAVFAGVPLEIVSHGARHSSPVITRVYSHPHQEALRAANDEVARLVSGRQGDACRMMRSTS